MGIKTKLKDYQVGKAVIPVIVDRFKKRGINIGERGDLKPEDVAKILESQLS
jgi:alcohol dehydrogenase YqhD (iron-dependent ADH family)